MNLIHTKNFINKPSWIADRIGLPKKKVIVSIVTLKRLKIIEEVNGSLSRKHSNYRTSDDIKNIALKKSHHETLQLASNALDFYSIELRDFTWPTLPFDLKKIKEAKEIIRKFQDEFMELTQENAEFSEVYRLSIQLFPLTKITT